MKRVGSRRLPGEGDASSPAEFGDEPVPLPLEDSIDLHPFPPAEIGDLVDDWLDEVVASGRWTEVRIVHGRGTGAARDTVRARLSRRRDVVGFADAPEERGGRGATIVRIRVTPAEG